MKRIIAVLLTILALLASAASLAEAPEDLSEGSRLVGLLITMEDLSAFTDENGVLLAACSQREPYFETEYTFEGVSGLRLICFMTPEGADGGSTMVSNVDDGISAVHFDADEQSNAVRMDAAISYVPGQEEVCFYYNPVLISNSGQVFAVPGDYMAVSAAMNPPGSSVGQTIRDERRHTAGGREEVDATTVSVQINAVRAPAEVRLLQFSAAHELLKSDAYIPGAVPDTITMSAEADYLLVETVEKDGATGAFTRREVLCSDSDYLNTWSCREDGICICHYHDVLWER